MDVVVSSLEEEVIVEEPEEELTLEKANAQVRPVFLAAGIAQDVHAMIISYMLPRKVTLVSKEGKEMQLSCRDASISVLLNAAGTSTVKLDRVPNLALEAIIDYLKHRKGQPGQACVAPLKSQHMRDNCADPWDAAFIDNIELNLGRQALFDIITASNYLDISCLLKLSTAKVAALVKGGKFF